MAVTPCRFYGSTPSNLKIDNVRCYWIQGRRKGGVGGGGGGGGSDDPPFLRANFIHFLYKVLGQRSVQKTTF